MPLFDGDLGVDEHVEVDLDPRPDVAGSDGVDRPDAGGGGCELLDPAADLLWSSAVDELLDRKSTRLNSSHM